MVRRQSLRLSPVPHRHLPHQGCPAPRRPAAPVMLLRMFRPYLPALPHQSIQALLLVRHRVNRQVCPLLLLLAELRALSPAAVQANPQLYPQLSRRVIVRRHSLRLSPVTHRRLPHQGFPALRRPAAPATRLRTFRPYLLALPRQSIQALLLAWHRVNRQVCPLRLLLAELRALSPAAAQANPQLYPQLSRRVMVRRHSLRLSLVHHRHLPHQGFPALRRPAAPATLLRTFRPCLPALPHQSIQALLLVRH